MICPNCNTLNDNENVFCVNCGTTISLNSATNIPPPTEQYQSLPKQNFDTSPSIETACIPQPQFNPAISYVGEPSVKKSSKKFVWIGLVIVLFLLAGGVGGAIYFINQQVATAEVLPDHLGMFVQNGEKNAVSEIIRQDYSNALLAKDDLMKNDVLPVAENKPNLILYSDGKDIPLNDLKLVQLDTIKNDGSLKQINFQASPVEGKPEMKRLRIPDGLANGKYAFALFDGFLDEGKHKFWAFQIQNAEKSDNGDLAKVMTISPKPKPPPKPKPTPTPNPTSIPLPKSPSNLPLKNNPNMMDDAIIETSTSKTTVAPNMEDRVAPDGTTIIVTRKNRQRRKR